MFKSPLFYLVTASTRKSRDAGNSEMQERSRKVLPVTGKVKVLDIMREFKKNRVLRWLKPTIRTSIRETEEGK